MSFITRLRGADATILQRELISTIPTFEKLLPGKKILDVDDAIFLYRKGLAAKNAARASIGVVCGNSYLADYFSQYSKTHIIPTGVDVNKMKVDRDRINRPGRKIVGWIGTPSNLPFFRPIIRDLQNFFQNNSSKVELRIVTSSAATIPSEMREFCTFVKWHPGIEYTELPKWSVGLMPLDNTEWVKGKCSFKMLQYMSAGVPVIVSPYGMNAEILARSDVGFGATTGFEWYQALETLVNDATLNSFYGKNARELSEKEFSLECIVKKWVQVLETWVGTDSIA